MYRRAFYLVDAVKIKVELLLQHSDNSLSSESREILNLVHKQVDSFEEIAKTTLDTDLDKLIRSEAGKLGDMLDKIESTSEDAANFSIRGNMVFQPPNTPFLPFRLWDYIFYFIMMIVYTIKLCVSIYRYLRTAKLKLVRRYSSTTTEPAISIEVENLKQKIDSFTYWLKREEERCSDGLYNLIPTKEEEEAGDGDVVSSRMIGVSDVYQELKDKLRSNDQVISLVGMPGIGKTTLAKKLFHDPTVVECYDPTVVEYQVPLCFRLKLLRELDALSIRFYEFPVEVLQLVRLKYLALTSNGTIPPSISQLSSLQFLIVDRHQNIKSYRDQSYLPMEIWGLQDLKHLQVMGSDLPDPRGASLLDLTTLSNVSARSCTKVVLNGIPNLSVLQIQIELAPEDNGDKPLSCFTHISNLWKLESLKCIIVNPEVVPPVAPFLSFPPSYLMRLSLSGLGYHWKEMGIIASLPYLSVLKLKNYAFQGPEWGVEERGFIQLDSLVIEDTDLVDWQFGCGAFERLASVVVKNCYNLEKICGEFGQYMHKIELVDCNPSCAEEMRRATTKNSTLCVLQVHSSWEDAKKLKT